MYQNTCIIVNIWSKYNIPVTKSTTPVTKYNTPVFVVHAPVLFTYEAIRILIVEDLRSVLSWRSFATSRRAAKFSAARWRQHRLSNNNSCGPF